MVARTGLEWFIDLGGFACTGLSAQPEVDESTMAELDDYDPRKPEYIAEATEEEVEQTDANLLARQIAKLEAATAHRQERGGKVQEKRKIFSRSRPVGACHVSGRLRRRVAGIG